MAIKFVYHDLIMILSMKVKEKIFIKLLVKNKVWYFDNWNVYSYVSS